MTNKAHTTLTIALAITVAVLLADKTIEPAQAQAQNCATADDLNNAVQTISSSYKRFEHDNGIDRKAHEPIR